MLLDTDLAALYEVETRVFNQTVKRNLRRFPPDFMFQLTDEEFKNLISQSVTSSWGGRRKLPLTFTEHDAIMAQPKSTNRPIVFTADVTGKPAKS